MNAWTETDQAELDALLYEFVSALWKHSDGCYRCWRGEWCPAARSTWAVVMEWRYHRQLLSKAETLRVMRSLVEAKVGASSNGV